MPQSFSSILIHLIFSTKQRLPWITPDVEGELHAYMATIFNESGSPAFLIKGTADHVHALFSLARTQTIANLVELVKKRSSKWIKTKGEALAHFQWQTGYAAFSIGESSKAALLDYIARQKEHHRQRTFQEEYRELFKNYNVEFDEKYGWD